MVSPVKAPVNKPTTVVSPEKAPVNKPTTVVSLEKAPVNKPTTVVSPEKAPVNKLMTVEPQGTDPREDSGYFFHSRRNIERKTSVDKNYSTLCPEDNGTTDSDVEDLISPEGLKYPYQEDNHKRRPFLGSSGKDDDESDLEVENPDEFADSSSEYSSCFEDIRSPDLPCRKHSDPVSARDCANYRFRCNAYSRNNIHGLTPQQFHRAKSEPISIARMNTNDDTLPKDASPSEKLRRERDWDTEPASRIIYYQA